MNATGPTRSEHRAAKRVAIVLGAGGPVGHAFHAGLLRAIRDVRGWDPREAHLVVGTSAGAQVGALLRAGMCARDLAARAAGETLSRAGQAIAAFYTRPSHDAPEGPAPPYRPASARYVLSSLARPWRARPGRLASALLPAGRVCLRGQASKLRELFGERWPDRGLWITAVCLHTGQLTAFGKRGAPLTDVGTAVACSGAVPSVCAPIEVGGRLFVDGGMASATNLDLLQEADDEHDPDTVIVSSPLSVLPPMRVLLAREVRRLRARGKCVVVFEPSAEAAEVMGYRPMDTARAPAVAKAAYRVMLRELEARRDLVL